MPVLFPGARQCSPPPPLAEAGVLPQCRLVGWLLSLLLGDHEAVSNLVSQGVTGK